MPFTFRSSLAFLPLTRSVTLIPPGIHSDWLAFISHIHSHATHKSVDILSLPALPSSSLLSPNGQYILISELRVRINYWYNLRPLHVEDICSSAPILMNYYCNINDNSFEIILKMISSSSCPFFAGHPTYIQEEDVELVIPRHTLGYCNSYLQSKKRIC